MELRKREESALILVTPGLERRVGASAGVRTQQEEPPWSDALVGGFTFAGVWGTSR